MCQLIFGTDAVSFAMSCGIICLCYLLILSIQDIRRQSVSMWLLVIGIAAAIFYQIVWSEQPIFLCTAGAVIGVGFIGVSWATREGIGYGDSILILALGIYLGLWDVLYLLMISFALSAVFSMIILAACRYHKKKTFPFIPFLTAGYLVLFFWENILRG